VRLTERVLKDFEMFHLRVAHLIINNLVKDTDCTFHRQRSTMQRKYVNLLRETYGQRMSLVEVPLLPYEVRGVKRISQVSNLLFPDLQG
jgi:anion-transporting  ArsA/GET3 family ATPase